MTRLAARRRENNIKVGHERWLVSYSDLVTLLFAFFVVMYSVSQVSESKYRSLAETLNAAFSNENQRPSSDSNENRDNPSTDNPGLAKIDSLFSDLENALKGFPVEGRMNMGANENWIELTLNSELLFTSGNAEPNREAREVFARLADLVEGYDNEIRIEGHTDNVPIRNSQYQNNWALASARAVSIVDFLSFQGVQPDRMSAIAHGEFRPIADNATEAGRAKNRRVVVRISDKMIAAPQTSADSLFSSSESPVRENQNSQTGNGESETYAAPPNFNEPNQNRSAENRSGGIQPVRLKGGDLLFTSDPDLPRSREIEDETNQE